MLHGQTRYHLASRFLDEVPAGLMKWLTPRFASERREAFASPAASARAAPRRTEHGLRSVAERDIGFRIGQNVTHPKFGAGVVVDAEGHGSDARVQVNFGKLGVKWLAVAVAKLEAA
jgi:DNA helicase-2/ATP-dependent DNA helicase PcrA